MKKAYHNTDLNKNTIKQDPLKTILIVFLVDKNYSVELLKINIESITR